MSRYGVRLLEGRLTAPTPRHMAFETDTDADLLAYMAMQDDDPDGARAAWGVLYDRHAKSVYKLVRHAFGRQFGGDQGAADIVGETFRKAHVKAHTFAPQSDDADQIRDEVRAWLCQIARRIALDLLRKRAKLPLLALVEDEDIPAPEVDDGDDMVESEQLQQAREAFAESSEREQIVLLETMQWFNQDTGKSQMPKGVAKALAERLDTTPANIRQIRRRALERFEKRLGVELVPRANQ